jgi:hypothetical protein
MGVKSTDALTVYAFGVSLRSQLLISTPTASRFARGLVMTDLEKDKYADKDAEATAAHHC